MTGELLGIGVPVLPSSPSPQASTVVAPARHAHSPSAPAGCRIRRPVAAATHLSVTAPANASIGVAVSVTVTALDAYGNIATGYVGTIKFTSSDSKAILPSNYTFVAGDAGVHTFTVTFKSSGTQTLTATDTHTGSIKGSASVKVS